MPWGGDERNYSANATDKAILNPRFELVGDRMSQYRQEKPSNTSTAISED
jgi:hypothetical protein